MKINPQSPSKKPSIQELRQQFEQTNQQGINPEPIYAKVNKPRRQQPPKQPTAETVYAPQQPLRSPYVPQNPPENPYATPRGGLNPQPVVNPYSVTDLRSIEGYQEGIYKFENPIYEGSNGDPTPPQGKEHIYEEIDVGGNGGSNIQHRENPLYQGIGSVQNGGPTPPLSGEPIYEEIDVGGNGGSNIQHRENPLYQGIGSVQNGGPTPPLSGEPIYEEIDVGGNGGSNIQHRENPLYQTSGSRQNSRHSPEPTQQPQETPYVVQTPPEGAYMAPRGGPNPRKLVNPYAVGDLREQEGYQEGIYKFENPIYEGIGTGGNGAQSPQGTIESASAEGPSPNKTAPLTKEQLTQQLQKDLRVEYGADEVRHWSKIVFGNANALNKQLSDILEDPEQGRQVAQKFAESPGDSGKFAGKKVLGIRSPQRKQAEGSVESLCRALKNHAETVEKVYKSLTRNQEKQQDRERGESPERHPSGHRHHHHHHAREERRNPPQHDVQPRRQATPPRGMAFAM